MDYLEFSADLQGKQVFAGDIITAQLAEIEFESFTSEQNSYKAYIQKDNYNEQTFLECILYVQELVGEFSYSIKELETKNWNEEWESNFHPVFVDKEFVIKASFHDIPNEQEFTHSIIIDPKMSFGTGHHETTFCVLQNMASIDFTGKRIADCGSGTGVLAIAGLKMGASYAYAFDYDPICYENTLENIEKNDVQNMDVEIGTPELLEGKKFDIILANINRNILVRYMQYLSSALTENGVLIVSGFYDQDMPVLDESTAIYGLQNIQVKSKNKWTSIVYKK